MQYAAHNGPNGERQVVDASGKPLGTGDVDRPMLHVLPKLLVPASALPTDQRDGITCDKIKLEVIASLPVSILPEGGIKVRQPYPNRRYFVGGSALIRNGWLVPLPEGAVGSTFRIEFRWDIEGALVVFHRDDWHVRHLIHVTLKPGRGRVYSMDGALWPEREAAAVALSPISRLGILDDATPIDAVHRDIVAMSLLCDDDEMADPCGSLLEERIEIEGIPLEQAWTIDHFQDEQAHEIQQAVAFTHHNEAHRANASAEMPPALFVRAVELARRIPFDRKSAFAAGVAGIPGGLEFHPALRLLCGWWEIVRPAGDPFPAGMAMPLVRVRDDGEYWWGYHETPNSKVEGFNPRSGRDVARVGDFMLVLFIAEQASADLGELEMVLKMPSGADYLTIGVPPALYQSGQQDEAWYCLQALASFPERFPAAWAHLNDQVPSETDDAGTACLQAIQRDIDAIRHLRPD